MSTAASPPQARPPLVRRTWIPLSVAVLVLGALALVWALPPDFFDRGIRITISTLVVFAGVLASSAWFVFGSGLSRGVRLAYVAFLVSLAAASVLAVRRIDFSGDMIPWFEFRWEVDRHARVAAHRAAHASEAAFRLEQDVAAAMLQPGPLDSPEYRGVRRDGVVAGPALAREWTTSPPKEIWRQPVGGGYAAFIVAGPAAYTIEQRFDNEAVVCYDLASGAERWIHEYPAFFQESMGGEGPRATPTLASGRIYSLGATGQLVCLDAATGEKIWRRDLFQENATQNLVWGMSGSPLVADGLVIVNPGAQKGTPASRAVLAFDAGDGSFVWGSRRAQASYASPMLVELAGRRGVLIFDAVGLAAVDPTNGEELWQIPWVSDFDINAAQPIALDGERLFISSAAGCAVLHVSHTDAGWKVDTVWKNRNMKCSYANPIAYDGHVYGLDEGILTCVDLADGKRKWKAGRHGHGQMLLAGDLLVVLAEDGQAVLVEATPEEYRELGSFPAIEGRTWNNPTLVDGVLYVRNHLEMAAYRLPLAEAAGPADGDENEIEP